MSRLPSLMAGVALLLGACGSTPALDPATLPAELRPGYTLFETRCSRCHGLERPLNARVSEGGWPAYVRRMSKHPAAGISPKEQAAIAKFLEGYHDFKRQQQAAGGPT